MCVLHSSYRPTFAQCRQHFFSSRVRDSTQEFGSFRLNYWNKIKHTLPDTRIRAWPEKRDVSSGVAYWLSSCTGGETLGRNWRWLILVTAVKILCALANCILRRGDIGIGTGLKTKHVNLHAMFGSNYYNTYTCCPVMSKVSEISNTQPEIRPMFTIRSGRRCESSASPCSKVRHAL